MNKNAFQILLWGMASIVTVRMTIEVIHHDMSVMTTVAIALSVLLTSKQGTEGLLRILSRGLNGAGKKATDTE